MTNDKTKILKEDEQLYTLESARMRFHENLSALLEIQSTFSARGAQAVSQKKDYVSLTVDQVKIISGHLLTLAAELGSSYDAINNTNKLLIFENRFMKGAKPN